MYAYKLFMLKNISACASQKSLRRHLPKNVSAMESLIFLLASRGCKGKWYYAPATRQRPHFAMARPSCQLTNEGIHCYFRATVLRRRSDVSFQRVHGVQRAG